jgi:hypothetical protein
VLPGLAKSLPKQPHASDNAAGNFIIALAASTDHSFDTTRIDLQCFGGMAVFARFGKFVAKCFAAAEPVGNGPGVREQASC